MRRNRQKEKTPDASGHMAAASGVCFAYSSVKWNFWPIYNSVSEELDKAMRSTFSSYMELEKAINENKSDKEVSRCLERYLDALSSQDEIRSDSVEKYRKILPDRKVAKIFVAEEKFRRQHIRMLQHGHRPPQGQANK